MFNPKKTVASILVISIILLSGCIEDTDTEIINNSDNTSSGMDQDNFTLDSMVKVENLPTGYEILATLPISDYNKFSENIIDSKEGAYRDEDNFDVFLDIIELDSESAATEFIFNYKSQYEQLFTGDRFTNVNFNEHSGTRIKTYTYRAGNQLPKYQIIWNKDNIVFIVRSNSNLESSAMNLAIATGY
ncbi:MAG: hypothetical protein K8R08_07375 [Methanosarcinales archaeon]|nr:hypothetical protein [Methanosarcinales archaeon]